MKFLIIFVTTFSLSHALTFTCMFPSSQKYCNYFGIVRTISYIGNDRKLVRVLGDHRDGNSNLNVEKLTISNHQSLTFIPRNMSDFFPNLRKLDMNKNSIGALNRDDLKGLWKLTSLSLADNNIKIITRGFFENNLLLERINFSNNKIKIVSEFVFDSLYHLKSLDFTYNKCINQAAHFSFEFELLKEHLDTRCKPVPSRHIGRRIYQNQITARKM